MIGPALQKALERPKRQDGTHVEHIRARQHKREVRMIGAESEEALAGFQIPLAVFQLVVDIQQGGQHIHPVRVALVQRLEKVARLRPATERHERLNLFHSLDEPPRRGRGSLARRPAFPLRHSS